MIFFMLSRIIHGCSLGQYEHWIYICIIYNSFIQYTVFTVHIVNYIYAESGCTANIKRDTSFSWQTVCPVTMKNYYVRGVHSTNTVEIRTKRDRTDKRKREGPLTQLGGWIWTLIDFFRHHKKSKIVYTGFRRCPSSFKIVQKSLAFWSLWIKAVSNQIQGNKPPWTVTYLSCRGLDK